MNEQSIFLEALQQPLAERNAYLDRVCGDNASLRLRVEKLLAAHLASGSFMDEPATELSEESPEATTSAFLPDSPDQPKPLEDSTQLLPANPAPQSLDHSTPIDLTGTVIAGKYTLVEIIGEGGMGSVWRARQMEPVKRSVAVKLIKPGMDSRQVLIRFEAERQALALMDHPNIARVLDGGLHEGRPYFVMELIKGVPITNFCDSRKLTPQERLDLFVPVCQAIQHAHQKGIIHRDIKPSNVLIALYDDKPVPKVIDFGVAKATSGALTEQTLETGFSGMVGTPQYMSPEQATFNNLDIDTRSDVYALGILLYELLTGSPPFTKKDLEKKGILEMLRVVREEEPPRPSIKLSSSDTLPSVSANRRSEPKQLTGLLRNELDWIVMKALEKDRSRRYETANGFAADVLRYLSGEPVLAHPPSSAYRMKKFIRKYRGQFIAGSLVLLTLLGGIIGTTMGMLAAREATKQEKEARIREADRAEGEARAKEQADAKRKEAEQNFAFARKGNEILGSVFAGLDPKQIADSERPLQDILRENLGKAVLELEGSAIGDPLEVAAMQNTLGLSLRGLGDYSQAVVVLNKAMKTRQQLLGLNGPKTLDTMDSLAGAYQEAGKLDLAIPLFLETLKLREKNLGFDDAETLSSKNNLAVAYREAAKLDLAIPLFLQALKQSQETRGPGHPYILQIMNNLAGAYQDDGKLDLAIPLFEEILKLRKESLSPNHPDLLFSMNNLAVAYRDAAKLDLAMTLLQDSLIRCKATYSQDHPHTLQIMNNLAGAYQDAGKLDLAIPIFDGTLKLRKERLGPRHPDTLASMNNLALAYRLKGKLDQALPLFQETVNLYQATRGPDHPGTLQTMDNLAGAYQDAGKLDLAISIFEETLKLRKGKLGPRHPNTFASMNNLAVAYRLNKKLELALPLFEETLNLYQANRGPNHPNTLQTMDNLAGAYQDANKLDLAIPLFEETLQLRKDKLGRDHPSTLVSMNNLAKAYLDANKLDLALPLFEKTVQLMIAKIGPDHPHTLTAMNNLATAYWKTKQVDRSVSLFEKTLQLQEKKLGRQHPQTQQSVANLGCYYRDAGRLQDALPLLEEAYQASKINPWLGWVGVNLLDAYLKAGKSDAAKKLLMELLPEQRKQNGKESPELAGELIRLAVILMHAKIFSEAEPLLRECLAIREKTQPDAWSTFNTLSMLGGSLLGQKKYAEAEPLLLKGYEGMRKREANIPPAGATRIPEAIDRLIDLYTAMNQPDEVKKWQAERAKYSAATAVPPREKIKAPQEVK